LIDSVDEICSVAIHDATGSPALRKAFPSATREAQPTRR
jgi:hypothetical protein